MLIKLYRAVSLLPFKVKRKALTGMVFALWSSLVFEYGVNHFLFWQGKNPWNINSFPFTKNIKQNFRTLRLLRWVCLCHRRGLVAFHTVTFRGGGILMNLYLIPFNEFLVLLGSSSDTTASNWETNYPRSCDVVIRERTKVVSHSSVWWCDISSEYCFVFHKNALNKKKKLKM